MVMPTNLQVRTSLKVDFTKRKASVSATPGSEQWRLIRVGAEANDDMDQNKRKWSVSRMSRTDANYPDL